MTGQEIKTLREQYGWTQQELATELGVSISTVNRWEKEGHKPSRMARRQLAALQQKKDNGGGI